MNVACADLNEFRGKLDQQFAICGGQLTPEELKA